MGRASAAAIELPEPKPRRVSVADLFCGAGSLSMGANDAMIELGMKPKFVAVNHWDVATQTYARNHPGASVHCVTLDAAFPAQLVPSGKLDLLMAGIECTFFSQARGGKPVNDQQRMSGWHVVRWCTELRVKRLLLENVPEFVKWGPVRNGKPIKSREGEYFWAWWRALESIGFKLDMRVLNCADYGDATTRHRLFIIGRSDGGPLRWPTPTHAKVADMFGVERWRSARDIIDRQMQGASIFDRKRPLAPKTLARIAAGIVKFKWPEPFLVILRHHCDARGIDLPIPTLTAGGTHVGLVQPFTLPLQQSKNRNRGHRSVEDSFGERESQAPRVHSIDEPTPTICAQGRTNVVQPGRNYDILFRMLEPHELAAAMSISEPDRPYHFIGNKTEVVRQIGQAVPRRTGRALARALMAE